MFIPRTDLPRYKIFSRGRLVDDVLDLGGFEKSWDDRVSFYLGCSFTWERPLIESGVGLGNFELGLNTSVYLTNIEMKAVGAFHGSMIVSMRMIEQTKLAQTFLLTGQYPTSHGAPIHIGNPARIGVKDLAQPDYGDKPVISADGGEVPVFWACGVSIQEVIKHAGMFLYEFLN